MNDMKRDSLKMALVAVVAMAASGGMAWLSLQPGGVVADEMERVAYIEHFGNIEYRKVMYEMARDRDRERRMARDRYRSRDREQAERLGLPPGAEKHVHHWYVRKDRVPSKVIPSATRVVDQFHCPVCDEPLNLHDLQRAESSCGLLLQRTQGTGLWVWREPDDRPAQSTECRKHGFLQPHIQTKEKPQNEKHQT